VKRMAEGKRNSTTVGWIGMLCLVPYGTVRFAPAIADTYLSSSFGKLAVLGALLAGVLLTTVAAVRSSRWWLVAVVAGAISLADLYVHTFRIMH
jgi:hypothetical protein